METEYKFRALPKQSKSRINTMFYFCPYLAYCNDYLGERSGEVSVRTAVGTDAHMILAEFWKVFDINYLYKEFKVDPNIDLENNPITYYFYGICMELTPKYDREVQVLQRIYWKFAKLQAARFLDLYQMFKGNKIKVYKYFTPEKVEQYYYNEDLEIYGTIDCVYKIPKLGEQLTEALFISDIKTGNIPASVRRGAIKVGDETSVKVPPKFMFEIHFYALLYLTQHGWYFKDEKVRKFVLNNEYFDEITKTYKSFGLGKTKEEEQDLQKKKKKYIKKINHKLYIYNYALEKEIELNYGDLIVGYLFLTGDPNIKDPVVVKKKFTYSSFKAVLLKINLSRAIWFNKNNNEFYLVRLMKTRPEYNKYKCDNCSRKEKCLLEIEQEFKKRK